MKTYTIPPACLAHPDWGIHPNHAQLLYNILLIPQIRTYLEIGCGYGVSTSAAVQAISGRLLELQVHLCDTKFHEYVLRMAHYCGKFNSTGVKTLAIFSPGSMDCVFVDGDHSHANVAAEIKELRRLGVPTIIAHDTHSKKYPGPAQFLEAYSDYESIHDKRWNGLFIASRIHHVMEQVRWVYAEWCEWLERKSCSTRPVV